jgi:hypothetical protein
MAAPRRSHEDRESIVIADRMHRKVDAALSATGTIEPE